MANGNAQNWILTPKRQNPLFSTKRKNTTPIFFLLLFAIDVSQKQKKSEKNHAGHAIQWRNNTNKTIKQTLEIKGSLKQHHWDLVECSMLTLEVSYLNQLPSM